MKTTILALTFLLTATICFGQEKQKTLIINGTDINKIDAEYIEIVGYTTVYHGKNWAITFDIGEEYFGWKGHKYQTETGVVIDFNSPMHALNYLIKCNWEFVQCTGGMTGNNATMLIYLLRKKKNFGDNLK